MNVGKESDVLSVAKDGGQSQSEDSLVFEKDGSRKDGSRNTSDSLGSGIASLGRGILGRGEFSKTVDESQILKFDGVENNMMEIIF